ncbi:uncharacterized protein LOC112566908 [Pomacea canaliculata]|uniref:uncharacterized protein LOC112566908 n=1 Tax=Pomacea canaliculata TaxID=400727 RepID=UPI000D734A9D|nr:uncharacterized protein LOC112566908 [Pomacea canaliculata]
MTLTQLLKIYRLVLLPPRSLAYSSERISSAVGITFSIPVPAYQVDRSIILILSYVHLFRQMYYCFPFCVSTALYITRVLSEQRLLGIGVELYQKSVSYFYGINFAFRTTSGFYAVVIAIERCLCVVFPLRAQYLVTTRTIGMILIFFAIFSQLGFASRPLISDVITTEASGISQWILVPSDIYVSNKNVIDTIVYTIFHTTIPLLTFCIVSLATVITVVHLKASVSWRRSTSCTSLGLNVQQLELTQVLVLASCVYIVSLVPAVLVRIVRLCAEEFSINGIYQRYYDILSGLANKFPVIDSSSNFFIYYNHSSKYKTTFNRLFHGGYKNKHIRK